MEKLQQNPEFATRDSMIAWLYSEKETSVARIASLARVILDTAEEGDAQAVSIVKSGAAHLVKLVEVLKKRLRMPNARIALGGSLLTNDTMLSREVMAALLIAERPKPLYEPVVGAALLARLNYDGKSR